MVEVIHVEILQEMPRTLNMNIGLDFEEQTRTKLFAVTVCKDLKKINIIYWTTEANLLTFKLK